jgi:hypothetical protein
MNPGALFRLARTSSARYSASACVEVSARRLRQAQKRHAVAWIRRVIKPLTFCVAVPAIVAAIPLALWGNSAPSARFDASQFGEEPGLVSFDATSSSDVDGSISQFSWDFGDGSGGMGRRVSHSYAQKGTYTVTLVVVDNVGASDMADQQVIVRSGSGLGVVSRTVPHSSSASAVGSGDTEETSGVPTPVLVAIGACVLLWLLWSKGSLDRMTPRNFEKRVASRFEQDGWHARVTPRSSDGGYDISLERKSVHAIAECKKWTKPVGVDVIRKVYGVLRAHPASKAYIVTTSRYTRGAKDFARGKRSLELVDGERLKRWLDTSQKLENVQ